MAKIKLHTHRFISKQHAAGLTDSAFAEALGITAKALGHLQSGSSQPSRSLLASMATVLNVNPDDLLDTSEDKPFPIVRGAMCVKDLPDKRCTLKCSKCGKSGFHGDRREYAEKDYNRQLLHYTGECLGALMYQATVPLKKDR